MLQIAVLQNHQQGRDTHLRQVRSKPANSMKSCQKWTWPSESIMYELNIRWKCTVLWRTVWSRPQSWATTPRSASSSSRASGVHYGARMRASPMNYRIHYSRWMCSIWIPELYCCSGDHPTVDLEELCHVTDIVACLYLIKLSPTDLSLGINLDISYFR